MKPIAGFIATHLIVVLGGLAPLAGCASSPPLMMPAPVIFKDPRLDLMATIPPELRTPTVPVFYATTRAPAGPDSSGHYTSEPGDAVRLGAAYVKLGKPQWGWRELLDSHRTSRPGQPREAQVEAIEEFGVASKSEVGAAEHMLIERINARLEREKKEIVLYIHGYRVSFDDVSVLAGSFTHFLGNEGAIVTFQWPTGGYAWNYLTDCPRAKRYVPDIVRLLELLARNTKARHINIIAYSCGSPLLAQALATLHESHPNEERAELARRFRIGNVIFAAADLDLRTFAEKYVDPILDLSQQVIIYISKNDGALFFSSLLAGATRLGMPDPADLSREDIDRFAGNPKLQAIDVSDAPGPHEMGGMQGHGYWYANDWVSADVLISMRFLLPPEQRGLVREPGTANTWQMPDDYPQRLGDLVYSAAPSEMRRETRPE